MKELTKAEERVMQIVWDLEKAFTREILEQFKKEKPSYTTVATVLTVLEQKGFVAHEMLGNSKQYYPLISNCLLYTSPSPRDRQKSRMPSSA